MYTIYRLCISLFVFTFSKIGISLNLLAIYGEIVEIHQAQLHAMHHNLCKELWKLISNSKAETIYSAEIGNLIS